MKLQWRKTEFGWRAEYHGFITGDLVATVKPINDGTGEWIATVRINNRVSESKIVKSAAIGRKWVEAQLP